ncbi:hypothetical protein KBB27_02230 [Patescibacteria group bacterium]|nr:hypothetical protein [Patescibacteria group bacterium]
MHLVQGGCIVFNFGCMCGGKGFAMVMNAFQAAHTYSPQRVPQLFKPKRETESDCIESRIGLRLPAETLPDDVDLTCDRLVQAFEAPSIVGIDDAQFLYVPRDGDPVDPAKVARLMSTLIDGARRGSDIYLAGLDADYRAEPFPFSAALLKSPFVVKNQHFAVCTRCRQPTASVTQRLVNGEPAPRDMPTVVAKGDDAKKAHVTYEPRCLHCFVIPL